eukprot:gene53757-20583_t
MTAAEREEEIEWLSRALGSADSRARTEADRADKHPQQVQEQHHPQQVQEQHHPQQVQPAHGAGAVGDRAEAGVPGVQHCPSSDIHPCDPTRRTPRSSGGGGEGASRPGGPGGGGRDLMRMVSKTLTDGSVSSPDCPTTPAMSAEMS